MDQESPEFRAYISARMRLRSIDDARVIVENFQWVKDRYLDQFDWPGQAFASNLHHNILREIVQNTGRTGRHIGVTHTAELLEQQRPSDREVSDAAQKLSMFTCTEIKRIILCMEGSGNHLHESMKNVLMSVMAERGWVLSFKTVIETLAQRDDLSVECSCGCE